MDTLPTVYLSEYATNHTPLRPSDHPPLPLVSGANRGIGLQLIQVFSTRPNVLIFAGTRQFPLPDDHPLSQLSAQFPNKVYPLELNSADEADNHRAAQYIGSKTHKLDVIIANAGVSSDITPIATVSPNIMLRDFEINSLGPLILFQTMRELVSHSPDGGKFIVVSSVLGQIEESLSWASNAYGTSKAAVNFITKKIHIETPNICAFPIQ
jgi:NAD(P)-dependent dehydrogenase (short-subunit alcohol dehydrogenase family)